MKKTILLGTLLCLGSLANAQDSATTNTLQLSQEEGYAAPRGLLPFLGLGGGYTGYENIDAVEGSPATLKLLGSFYNDTPWIFDVGYGVNNQQFIQGTAERTAITDGVLEGAIRYEMSNRWQMGVVANQFYNQGTAYGADQADAHFVGLQALKEFNVSPAWIARAGVRAMSLTNNTDGLVNMYLVDLQLGWNPQAMRPTTRSVAAEAPTTEMVPAPASQEESVSAPLRPVTYSEANPQPILGDVTYGELVGAKPIEFSSAQAAVSRDDQRKLERVAKALEENKDLFDKVEVRGYADSSGSAAINQRISQQRAEQVSAVLKRAGLNSSDVVASGKGAVASGSSIAAEDRRAEIVFTGVKDEAKLKEILSNIE